MSSRIYDWVKLSNNILNATAESGYTVTYFESYAIPIVYYSSDF